MELLPSRDTLIRTGIDEKTLNLLVQEKVAEIMADRDAFVFEPFFRSRQIAYELKRLQTMPERQKWSVHFGTLRLFDLRNADTNSCGQRYV